MHMGRSGEILVVIGVIVRGPRKFKILKKWPNWASTKAIQRICTKFAGKVANAHVQM